MAFLFDGDAKTITLSTGTTSFDARDCYSRWKDWANSADGSWASFAFHAVGGDALGGGVYAGDYYFLQDGWTIVPQDASHTLLVSGNIYPATPGAQMFGSRAGRTIQIQLSRSSLTQTLAVGSGVLPADVTAIAAATRDQILSDGTAFPGARIDAAISSIASGLTPAQAEILELIALRIAKMRQLDGLDPDHPLVSSATYRRSGEIRQTVSTVNGVTTVTTTEGGA